MKIERAVPKRRIGYTHPRVFRRSIVRNARGFRRGQRGSAIALLRSQLSRASNRSYLHPYTGYFHVHRRGECAWPVFMGIRTATTVIVCERKGLRGGVCAHAFNICKLGRVCTRRLYLCTHRPSAVGRASFVECGLILMGTDDKQRKQASSLPGEICLLLPGVQWGLYTRTHSRQRRGTTSTCTGGSQRSSAPEKLPWQRRAHTIIFVQCTLIVYSSRVQIRTYTYTCACTVWRLLPAQMRANEGEPGVHGYTGGVDFAGTYFGRFLPFCFTLLSADVDPLSWNSLPWLRDCAG